MKRRYNFSSLIIATTSAVCCPVGWHLFRWPFVFLLSCCDIHFLSIYNIVLLYNSNNKNKISIHQFAFFCYKNIVTVDINDRTMMSNNFFKNCFSMKTIQATLLLSFAILLTVVFAGLVKKKNDTTLDTMNEQILYKGSTSSTKYPSQR
jgi:hypothetical protein